MSPERIVSAAILFRGRVLTGISHKVAVFTASLALGISPMTVWAKLQPEDQGFTATLGRFVSRAEAWVIAEHQGQIWGHPGHRETKPGAARELHSEEPL